CGCGERRVGVEGTEGGRADDRRAAERGRGEEAPPVDATPVRGVWGRHGRGSLLEDEDGHVPAVEVADLRERGRREVDHVVRPAGLAAARLRAAEALGTRSAVGDGDADALAGAVVLHLHLRAAAALGQVLAALVRPGDLPAVLRRVRPGTHVLA